jgi:hypothetical protein
MAWIPDSARAIIGAIGAKPDRSKKWTARLPGAPIVDKAWGTNLYGDNVSFNPNEFKFGSAQGINSAVEGAINQYQNRGSSRSSRVGMNPKASAAPSERDLARYSDLQVRSQYRPTLNELERQIANANAMGMQSDAAISGWGREAGQEIANAGQRNYKEVRGIQGGLGQMLGAIGASAGKMGTSANNRAFMRGAAGSAGMIAGLGAADQGWFNRARDVNAQTTNFYRNNARDQYAQQAFDLQQRRNDEVAAMRDARAGGRIQAKQTAFDNQQAGVDDSKVSGDRVGGATAQFYAEIAAGTPVADAASTYRQYLTNPAEIAIYDRYTSQFRGPAGSRQNTRLDQARAAANRKIQASK